MITKPVVNLTILKKQKRWVKELRETILNDLGDKVYEIKDQQTLAFEILIRIHPVNKKLENTLESVSSACLKVAQILKISKGVLSIFSSNGEMETLTAKPDLRTPIEYFLNTYIQINLPPGFYYGKLEASVRKDLRGLTELIHWYEQDSFIKSVNQDHVKPRNHEEKILFDYYRRCLAERNIITDYYFNGIKKRSLIKSNYLPKSLLHVAKMDSYLKDRPYQFSWAFSTPFFDCRKIDTVSHRIPESQEDNYDQYKLLYDLDKKKFYLKVFKFTPAPKLFEDSQYYLSKIPLKNNRAPIFEELKKLYKSRRWIGFYALALSQVEGLFSEMIQAIVPKGSAAMASLPEKVNFLRPYHDMSKFHFDYYQYQIPRLRNKFMHTGFDEDFKLKSFDLLFDLHHLLKIFYELNSPAVIIQKLIKERDPKSFVSHQNFGAFFNLIDQLTQQKRKELLPEIKEFERSFLCTETEIITACLEVAESLPNTLKAFIMGMEHILSLKSIKLSKLNPQYIKEIIGDEIFRGKLNSFFHYQDSQYRLLFSYHTFINGCRSYISLLPPKAKSGLNNINKEMLVNLKSITELGDKLGVYSGYHSVALPENKGVK